MIMQKMKTLLLTMVLTLGFAGAAFAATANVAGKAVDVGGAPLYVTFDATSASTEAAIDFTLPSGFIAEKVRVIEDYDATNANICEWFYGMPAASAIYITGSTGAYTYITSAGITVNASTGVVTVGTGCQLNSGNLIGEAYRYGR